MRHIKADLSLSPPEAKNRRRPPKAVHPLLTGTLGLNNKDLRMFTTYFYDIATAPTFFKVVLKELENYYNTMKQEVLANKEKPVYNIMYSKKQIPDCLQKVLYSIGSLAINQMRDIEVNTFVVDGKPAVILGTTDKSDAASNLWYYFSSSEVITDKKKLDIVIEIGGRWSKLLKNKKVGTIAVLYMIPPSLRSTFVRAADPLDQIPGILDRAEEATPYVEKLLELYTSSLEDSKKRKLPICSEGEPNSKRRMPRQRFQSQQPSTIQGYDAGRSYNSKLVNRTENRDPAVSQSSSKASDYALRDDFTTRDMKSHIEGASQISPMEDIHIIDGHIQATGMPRRYHITYRGPQENEKKLERYFDGPFLTAFKNHPQTITAKFPRDMKQDVEISIIIGVEAGLELIQKFGLQLLPTQGGGKVQQYSKIPRENLFLLGPLLYLATSGSSESVLGPVSAFKSNDTDDSHMEFSIMVDPMWGRQIKGTFRWQKLHIWNQTVKMAKKYLGCKIVCNNVESRISR